MTEFNYEDTEFDANAFDEDILDMQEGIEINTDFMNFDDPNEISMNISIQSKSAEEISREVESTLLNLLESNDRDVILAITGENHEASSILDPKVIGQFSSQYSIATGYNSAIRWYSKLAKLLPAEKFSVGDMGLTLKMGKKLFKKVVVPFLGDFKAELRDSSPMVSLIYAISDSIKDKDVQEQLSRAIEQGGKKAESDQLEFNSVDMSDAMLDTENVRTGEVYVDDNSGFGLTTVKQQQVPNISLLDLANKTIAEHFIESEQTDFEVIRTKLVEEGFTKPRINEILGIVKFIQLNKSMDSRILPEGNLGTGEVNFDFN